MKATRQKLPSNNLPTPLSTFIGRERELADVKNLLSSHRLVTLTGAGGSGKTRLSLRVAGGLLDEFEQGVWFVELASIFDSAFVTQAVASALNIHEQPGQPLMDVVARELSARNLLLILDNCEHLISACAQFAQSILEKCAGVKILATSREVLGITGEAAWIVPPLSLPGSQPWTDPASVPDALALYEESESVQLFVTRAQTLSSDFRLTSENGAWIAEICRQLDGLPLAIELAAARVRSLSVRQIAQRLDDRFHLLTGGSRTAPLRQQTLLSTLDWSYALLSEKEQKVLQRLSVFAGGATLDAVEAICSGSVVAVTEVLDTLSHLVDKSLSIAEKRDGRESRFHLLETIRQYALEKLAASGNKDEIKNRHLDYFIRWAQIAESNLIETELLLWLESYEAEHDNLRAALEWCNADPDRAGAGLQLVVACCRFWRIRGYLSEGRARLSAALSHAQTQKPTRMYARALFWEASLAYLQSDYPATRLRGEESLALWRELEPVDKAGLANTLDLLGELATEEGDYAKAPRLLEEALEIFRELDDPRGIGDMLMQLGWAYMRMGDYEKVAPRMEEALALFRENGQMSLVGFTLAGLGELAIRQEQYARATYFLEESLAIREQHGHKWGIGTSLGSLGWIALRQHDFKRMKELLGESLALRMEINDKGGIAWCLEKLAAAHFEQSRFQEAAKLFGHAEALRAPIGSVIDAADRPEYNRLLAGIRSALDDDAFAALWAAGASMQLEQVIDLALSEPKPFSAAVHTAKEKFGGLTAREREVAVLIAQGKSNREIAEAMTIGVKTVETYITRILNKLGFDSRVQIATWAVERGLK